MYTYITSFWISFPSITTEQGIEFPVLYSSFSLVAYFIHSSGVYQSISQFIPPPHPPLVSMFVLYVHVSISAFQIRSSLAFFQIPHICVNIQYLLFSFWLTSLSMTIFRHIHVSANDAVSFLFMAEQYSVVNIYHISLSILLLMDIYVASMSWLL